MNYYPFHIGDYAAHTRNLSLMEDLAYRRLLDAYYLAERPLDGCSTDVARALGMREHLDAVEYVLSRFFTNTDDGWVNPRADIEIERFRAKNEQASRAGRASAERRLNARSTPVEKNPTDVQPTNNQNQEPEPEPIVERARAPRGTRLPAEFALPDAWIEFAEKERPDLNPYDTGKRCIDHWHAKPGKEATKLDWFATWRNWVRGERAQRPTAAPSVQRESFRERDDRLAMDKYEEITGKQHPKRAAQNPAAVIDVTPQVQFFIEDDA